MEQWMAMNRKKNVEPKQRRKRTREAPRCYSRSIEEGTNARGYPKSKKKENGKRRTHAFCFCREVRTYAEGRRGN